MQKNNTKQNRLTLYNDIYQLVKKNLMNRGFSEDLASRRANIYAVKNTDIMYQQMLKEKNEYR